MAGEEYGRNYSWGNDPHRKGDYELASPCRMIDLPQTLLEPILVRFASLRGFKMRFNTEFISHVQDEEAGTVTTTVRDLVTKQDYRIRSKYLFGADGARGEVLRQLGIGLIKEPGQGLAINVLVKADLSHLMPTRMGNLHWILQPDIKHPDWGWTGIVRMVKPWTEWLFILFPTPGAGTDFNPTKEEYLGRVKEFIGDDTPAEILGVSKVSDIFGVTWSWKVFHSFSLHLQIGMLTLNFSGTSTR
jgi:2-polyprenyl-6-methoxyphenol hydroxylase-like FAD-dependent oxidoreductase